MCIQWTFFIYDLWMAVKCCDWRHRSHDRFHSHYPVNSNVHSESISVYSLAYPVLFYVKLLKKQMTPHGTKMEEREGLCTVVFLKDLSWALYYFSLYFLHYHFFSPGCVNGKVTWTPRCSLQKRVGFYGVILSFLSIYTWAKWTTFTQNLLFFHHLSSLENSV